MSMNLLPNYENAIISTEKLSGYCLNTSHARGKDKAFLFQKVFGLNEYHAEILKEQILDNLAMFSALQKEENVYGKKYSVLMKISIFGKVGTIQTGWIIEKGTDFPRLTSCYVKN
ncbi:MAG: DUF6883 domain-containing protein [Cytophagales bacterium]